jgi:hypothetical protein
MVIPADRGVCLGSRAAGRAGNVPAVSFGGGADFRARGLGSSAASSKPKIKPPSKRSGASNLRPQCTSTSFLR